MKSRRLLLKVVLAVMPSSFLLRFTSTSSQAFSTDTIRTVATRLTRQSSRAPPTPMTCHKRCTGTISRWSYSERPRRLPRPRPRRSQRSAYVSSSLSSSFRQDPPSEEGGSSSSFTSKPSFPSERPQTGPRVLAVSGEGFGAISTSGKADLVGSGSSSDRQQPQRERRPKQQQQQRRPRAPPRGNNLLIVGLGNPGEQYRRTRHNAGFLVAEELARRHGGMLKIRTAFQGEYCSISFKGKSIGILRPVTYMNHSGMAARKAVDFFKLPINAALVLVDEVALDFGKLRLKEKGSPGGHNGLKSIQAHLKTQDYNRLRIGIGACNAGPLSDHVLGEFTRSEKKELDNVIAEACNAVEYWIEEEDTAKVMTRFNG